MVPLPDEMTNEACPVKDDFYNVSHELSFLLRHATCSHARMHQHSTLGVDSGGWFRMDSLAARFQLGGYRGCPAVTQNKSLEWWKAFILVGIRFGASRTEVRAGKVRFQVAVEVSLATDVPVGWAKKMKSGSLGLFALQTNTAS